MTAISRQGILVFKMREATMSRFQNKVVLISGGARGQGAAEARMLERYHADRP